MKVNINTKSMIPEKYRELIEKLIRATRQKKVVWEQTSREAEYKAVIGSSMVTTDNWDFPDNVMNADVAIWNSNGMKVDSIQAMEGTEDYAEIMKLHSVARASFLRADETIADILGHLE